MKKTAFCLLLACQPCAYAGAGYYLVSVYENEGEKALDFKSWSSFMSGKPRISAPEFGISYMPDKRWYTELYATWLKREGSAMQAHAWTWQNDYLLTQGQYPFDLALHTNLEKYHDSSRGTSFEFGPVLQTEFGRLQVNANLFFERSYRVTQATSMQMKYQWQTRYRWRPALEFGLQGFGELGDWNNWAPVAQQSHRIGPVLAGALPAGDGRTFRYEAAYFGGKLFARPAHVFSVRLQYAF